MRPAGLVALVKEGKKMKIVWVYALVSVACCLVSLACLLCGCRTSLGSAVVKDFQVELDCFQND